MDKNHTSRWRLLDAVMFVMEQIALSSHIREHINVIRVDMESADKDTFDFLIKKLSDQEQLLQDSLEIRRKMMDEIHIAFKWDHEQRCSLKHAIGAYWYATEVLVAGNFDNGVMKYIQQKSYEQMVAILSLFVGEELVKCSRCLLDSINDKQTPIKGPDEKVLSKKVNNNLRKDGKRKSSSV